MRTCLKPTVLFLIALSLHGCSRETPMAPTRLATSTGSPSFVISSPLDPRLPAPGRESEEATPEDKDTTDVRKLTQEVAFFITPIEDGKKFKPPATRFLWGSFQFDGIVEAMEESLEFFSPEGKPLRASVSLTLTSQKITKFAFRPVEGQPGSAGAPAPGTQPLTQAPAGSTVQGLADGQGKGEDWQSIAAANGIENPRMLQPGQLLDMNASVGVSGGLSGGASLGAGIQIRVGS